MGKRLKSLFMALVMMVTTVISINGSYIPINADESGITVIFHFTNDTNTYDDYRLWLWTIGDGFEARMVNNGTEATYTLQENSSTLKIGYIVKLGEGWDAKDVDSDRYVDLTEYVSGTVNVNLKSKVSGADIDYSNAKKGLKVTSASTEDKLAINVKTNQAVTGNLTDVFKLKDTLSGEYISLASVTGEDTSYVLTVAQELNVVGSYEVEYLDVENNETRTFMIAMPDYYSSDEFEEAYTYTGDDLGATWSKDSTTFKVWAPLATDVKVNLYSTGNVVTDEFRNPTQYDVGDLLQTVDMAQDVNGTWVATVAGDLNGVYYTYTATVNGTDRETIDPYARTAGVNGFKGMVIDLDSTDPEGWDSDKNPFTSSNYTDASIYELHIRDFSYDASSGMVNKGKYLAFTEKGTKNSYGQSTGIDYLKDLGITHVQILPSYDFTSVDESNLDKDQFNWGYDPQNFNLPEGSYSTDPSNGAARVKEYKQMVKSLHDAGISVVMDVVYGHVSSADSFSVNQLTPSYYSRTDSNGSGCGNDTATERTMNRKFIIDSMVYWAKEYHINGFRIDQVYLFDIDTVNELTKALHEVDPNIILYGEGWSVSTNMTKDIKQATQGAAPYTPGFGYFNDGIRDSVKGGVFTDTEAGYVTRNYAKLQGILESLNGEAAWADEPTQVINYNSCHDNYTLFDKLHLANPGYTEEEMIKANYLAALILYGSQGVPFMQAGEEILRQKINDDGSYEGNSYASASSLNAIKWDDLNKSEYAATRDYYKGLIEFRKAYPELRMATYSEISNNFEYILNGTEDDDTVIEYAIKGESADGIVVILNPSENNKEISLPEGNWDIYVNAQKAGTEVLGSATGKVSVEPLSGMILVKASSANSNNTGDNAGNNNGTEGTNNLAPNQSVKTGDNYMAIALIAVLLVVCASVVVVVRKKKYN